MSEPAGSPEVPRPAEDGASEPRELRLDLPAVHSAARMARHLIRQFARGAGVVGAELDSLLLVADELLSNAVDHGGGGAAREEGELESHPRMGMLLALDAAGWRMGVSDQGGGRPEELSPLLQPGELPDLEDERGRGFFLVTQMVQRIEVRSSQDGLGLCITAVREYGAGD